MKQEYLNKLLKLCHLILSSALIFALPTGAFATMDVPLKGVVVGESENGTKFTVGMVERLAFFHLEDLDFNSSFEFRTLTIADITQGDSQAGLRSITDVLLQVDRGPAALYAVFEIEALVDELVADVNYVNLEQVVASYALPNDYGKLHAGWGVHIVDPEGTLVYGDEAPGVWLLGAKGPYSWNLGYIKRIDGNRGVPAGSVGNLLPGDRSFSPGSFNRTDVDTDIFWGRVGYNFGNVTVSPFLVINRRNTPQAVTSVFTCPLVGGGPDCGQSANGNPTVLDTTSDAGYFFPGVVLTGSGGNMTYTFEAAGRLGKIKDLPAGTFAVSGANPNGRTSFDANAFAFFGELAFDMSKASPGLAGITPYISAQFNSGDDDAFDDNMGGFVSISDLNQIIRKDSFNLRSISSTGAMTLGGACDGSFGFNTSARGTGPTMGTANEDAALASAAFFNNRCGKGDNPGMLRLNIGYVGSLAPKWDSKFVVSPMWFHETATIEAEAAGSRLGRGVDPLGLIGTPDAVRATAATLDVDNYMGTEINFNLGYSFTDNFRIGAFGSLFFPGKGAKDIGRLFLDDGGTDTAWMTGIEFLANF